ncbi:indole-3-glycerol phosphate synthase TrpC [Paenibacillus sp. GP183]|uniref:indole-3-glycerol phosphate synthase TrpC n=1 Tax=Paenibacillus sp. GP183 TaxID=1882751 RepID=UPI0008944822|nr:indole-3-glycerol phosphate synthase TrpC [Paenibacillus sp. GP183]SEB64117.1 indole-3-glycerol phosphate synthase [Paenibacillus sp. GP183]
MFLDKIVACKRQEVAALKTSLSLRDAEQQISQLAACLGFERALAEGSRRRHMGLIAEVKKASPSKGLIRPDFHPVSLAESYVRAGADCISVLTDVDFFQGSNDYLKAVRQAVQVPLLRKDFTIDELQIYEARLIGADAILLIAAILTTEQMKRFLALSRELGLDALVEVHDQAELDRALELDTKLIGINNRNLHSFATDLKTTEQLILHIPKGITIVSESGISSQSDMAYLESVGAHAVLIGEYFMRQSIVEQAVHDLMGPMSPSEAKL